MTPEHPTLRVPFNDLGRLARAERAAIVTLFAGVVESGWFITGSELEGFETDFAHYLSARHVIGVGNGTDALEIAMKACDVGPGSEVLMAANAGGYAATAAVRAGARPAFCDVDHTGLISAEAVSAAVDERTTAVVVTHLYGQCADVSGIRSILPEHVHVIEDCAQAHGARRNGQHAGTLGTIAAFSFYPTKNLGALGDGGAVVTSSDELGERVRKLRSYGWSSKYWAELRHGCNSRLDELQAAVLRLRLRELDHRNERRRAIVRHYQSDCAFPMLGANDVDGVAHLAVMVVPERDRIRSQLASSGIATDVHYPIPDYHQPAWRDDSLSLPTTESLCQTVLSLPNFPEMSDEEVEAVQKAIRSL